MHRFALFVSALLTSVASAHAGPMLVIASNQPGYTFGSVIDGREPIRIDDGFLTLIAATGQRVALEGPFNGVADPAPPHADTALLDTLSHLIKSELEAERSAPATLFATVPRRRPDRWSANVTHSGIYCLRASVPTLWRSYARGETTLTLARRDPVASASATWPAGEPTLAWPRDLPPIDGATYEASLANAVGRTQLTIRLIPDGLATDAHRAAWMSRRGCRAQALLVLDALAAGE